jgi:hypothetical protein
MTWIESMSTKSQVCCQQLRVWGGTMLKKSRPASLEEFPPTNGGASFVFWIESR